ncbi:hypothetical protein AGDE_11983 [Angomonas deanei]|nr:hypothetical protein AGDE_11983 [Angomonas deanei]|eukprot:EPY25174.1 hypothetical protein AGDE_11983 [Angomonas deanei]
MRSITTIETQMRRATRHLLKSRLLFSRSLPCASQACWSPPMWNSRQCMHHTTGDSMEPLFPSHTPSSWCDSGARDWMCTDPKCREVNPSSRIHCGKCEKGKPNFGMWKCAKCNTVNFGGVKQCKSCTAPASDSSEFWMCASCQQNNRHDPISNNSRCGFCLYNMAPSLLPSEEEGMAPHQETPGEGTEAEDPVHASPHYTSPAFDKYKKPLEPFKPKTFESYHSRLVRKAKGTTEDTLGQRRSEWMCRSCGGLNAVDNEQCSKCNAKLSPVDWECLQCAALNHMSRAKCFNCGVPIPTSWMCKTCGTQTSIYDKACRSCGEARAAVTPANPPRRAPRKNAPMAKKNNDWYCPACNVMNFAKRHECFKCGCQKPAGGDFTPSEVLGEDAPSVAPTQNNWTCVHCNSNNFRTRSTCWQCGAKNENAAPQEKEANLYDREGFQDAGKVSVGSAETWNQKGEWVCGKCFAKNYKGRQECFKCGSQKTVVTASRRANVRKPVKL